MRLSLEVGDKFRGSSYNEILDFKYFFDIYDLFV